MKKILFAIFFIIASLQFSFAKDEISKDYEVLPQKAKEFISNYFPKQEFSYMKIDGRVEKKEYEVYFNSGIMIEFNHRGEWKEIESKVAPIPIKFLPPAISEYVIMNYPNQQIYKIDRKRWGYEIELSNEMELLFDKDGKFKKMDDK